MKNNRNLRLVFWETTDACNLACIHCRRLGEGFCKEPDLDTRQGFELIDAICEVAKPVLVFSGGEPLLRQDLSDLALYARSKGIPTALATNGTLLDPDTTTDVSRMGFERVSVSIDGASPEVHDSFRNQQGAFDSAVEGCKRLLEKGLSLQVNTTVTKHNILRLEEIYQLVKNLKADAWHIFMFVPVGCGLSVPSEQQLAAKQYEEVLDWIADKALHQTPFIRATCAPQYFRILSKRGQLSGAANNPRLSSLTKGCLAGSGICFISHKGEVFPCGYLPVSCGNVIERPFKDIWENSKVLSCVNDLEMLEGKCRVCGFRDVCGGCRARAFAAGGNYLAEEPCCAYEP